MVAPPLGSVGRSGLRDFVLQRLTAVVLGAYGLCIVGFFASAPVDHARLVEFFGSTPMRMFTLLAVMALAGHAWIGMWTIGTDYVREHYFGRGHTVYRALYHLACLALIFVYVIWPLTAVLRLR